MILSQLGDGLAGVCMRDGEIILIKDEEDDSFVNMTACLVRIIARIYGGQAPASR